MHKLALILTAVCLLGTHARAVILQLDLNSTPDLHAQTIWLQSGELPEEVDQYQAMSNSGTAEGVDLVYAFEGATFYGTVDASATIGGDNALSIDLNTFDQYNALDGTGTATLSPENWTIQIIAEVGETNGTQVIIDWESVLSGYNENNGSTSWSMSFDGSTVLSGSSAADGSDPDVDFADSQSGQLTTYSIGDTISFDFSLTTETDGNGISYFDGGSYLSVTATVVPEPSALSLLGLGALVLLRRRR